jgi:hypothetical protein
VPINKSIPYANRVTNELRVDGQQAQQRLQAVEPQQQPS